MLVGASAQDGLRALQNLPSFDDIGEDYGREMADMRRWMEGSSALKCKQLGLAAGSTGIDVEDRCGDIVWLFLRRGGGCCKGAASDGP